MLDWSTAWLVEINGTPGNKQLDGHKKRRAEECWYKTFVDRASVHPQKKSKPENIAFINDHDLLSFRNRLEANMHDIGRSLDAMVFSCAGLHAGFPMATHRYRMRL
jgi:hypothetical protein